MGLMQEAVTVTALNQYISALMSRDDILSGIAVRGEISNCKHHTSGHLYFSLKDDGGVLKCVAFRSAASRLTFVPKDGMKVIAFGSVNVYSPAGQYQLYVQSMIPDGKGDLFAAFEQLKAKLEAEGLFDPERKKEIPKFPRTVGVITSSSGAAVEDIINIVTRRYPLAKLILYPVAVQGVEAPPDLIRAVCYFDAHPTDVVIIGRGGGSMEDLWCFNDEGLARAIADAQVPIISAVGHETDFTICDFVADLRAPTPSAAAELAVPDRGELAEKIVSLQQKAVTALRSRARLAETRLARYAESAVMKDPQRILYPYATALAAGEEKLRLAVRQRTDGEKHRLSVLAERLQGLSPLAVLARGYGAISSADGRLIRHVSDLTTGAEVRIRFADGTADAQITHVTEEDSHEE